jgi:hypothetical protein
MLHARTQWMSIWLARQQTRTLTVQGRCQCCATVAIAIPHSSSTLQCLSTQ